MLTEFIDWFRSAPTERKKTASLLLMIGVLITGVSVFGILLILRAQHPDIAPEEKKAEEVTSEEKHSVKPIGLPYEINGVSMAVMNRKGTRTAYAQFSLVLTCPDEESVRLMTMNRAKLVDSIFNVGSDFYLEDFDGPQAANSLGEFKKRLLDKFKNDYLALAPSEISLKDWIVN